MKTVKNDLPSDFKTIEIEFFGDLHIGSKRCDYKLINERIERVKNNENVYAIILGDIINNSTKNSVGDVYEEPLSPMQQIKTATTMFMPIKDKILCVVSGNHCDRSYKESGIDLMHFMCAELGISDKYDTIGCLTFIRFGSAAHKNGSRKMCYTMYVTHGTGQGGRLIGSKATGLARRGEIVDADVIVTGHTHQAITFRQSSYKVDYQNSSAYEKEQVFINIASTLGYEAYAEKVGLRPSSTINPVAILDGVRRNIIVKL